VQEAPYYHWLVEVNTMAGGFDFDQVGILGFGECMAVMAYLVLDRSLV
jgi:hypothetical protein